MVVKGLLVCDCRWILATYDVDVFDSETNPTVNVNTAPLNKGMDIPEFDYSRKEVEVHAVNAYWVISLYVDYHAQIPPMIMATVVF